MGASVMGAVGLAGVAGAIGAAASTVVVGAVAGAAIGGIAAAVSGGNILKGALTGGLIGGIVGGIGYAIAGPGMLMSSGAPIAGASGSTTIAGEAVTGMGAVTGGVGAAAASQAAGATAAAAGTATAESSIAAAMSKGMLMKAGLDTVSGMAKGYMAGDQQKESQEWQAQQKVATFAPVKPLTPTVSGKNFSERDIPTMSTPEQQAMSYRVFQKELYIPPASMATPSPATGVKA
jgi:hypothetical protein